MKRCPAHPTAAPDVAYGPWGTQYAKRVCPLCRCPLGWVDWPHAHLASPYVRLLHGQETAEVRRSRPALTIRGRWLVTKGAGHRLAQGQRGMLMEAGKRIVAAIKRGAEVIDVGVVLAAAEQATKVQPEAVTQADLFDFPVGPRGEDPKKKGAPDRVRGGTGAKRMEVPMQTQEVARRAKRASRVPTANLQGFPAPQHARETACRSCGARIIFGVTRSGQRMPLDATPRTDGLHVSHFDTCPDAGRWRGAGRDAG